MKRKLPIFLGLLLVGGVFLYMNFGNLAKNLTEKIASNALGVNVSISSMDMALQEKQVMVHGLKVSNPPGYKNAHAMTAEKISIRLDTASQQLIEFKDIQVDGSVINLEVTEKGNNLSDLKKLAMADEQKESVGSEQIRVIIKKMVIGASTINPSVTLLGNSMGSIKIPAVSLTNIGQGEGGIGAGEAIEKVLVRYISIAEGRAANAGLLDGVKGVVDRVEGVGKGTLGTVEGELQGLGKNIGNMLGD